MCRTWGLNSGPLTCQTDTSDWATVPGYDTNDTNEPPHDKTNKMICAPSEDSDQPNQSLRCPHEESVGPQLLIERTAKTLIRLGGCPGWSESLPGAQVILLVLSWGSSNKFKSLRQSEEKCQAREQYCHTKWQCCPTTYPLCLPRHALASEIKQTINHS